MDPDRAHITGPNKGSFDRPSGYFNLSRTATYSFLAALPLLLLYEVLILIVNDGEMAQVRVGADVWVKQLLAALGGTGMFSLGILVLIVGAIVFLVERKKKIPIVAEYFPGMVAESFLYAVVVAIIVSNLVGLFFSMAPDSSVAADLSTARMLVLSIGAGLYEELIFRVVLVGGLFWLFAQMFTGRTGAYAAAAVVGALAFSAVHYMGPLGDPFELPSFMFRFFFGLALNVIFLVRGFGVAAWTHALYDVLVVTHLLG